MQRIQREEDSDLWEFYISLFSFAQNRGEAIAYSKSSILVLCKGNQILYDYKH
ncbi:hypothetical protein GNF10_00885 [Nostoc sp. UCD121]|uniref:hypothetical protein n=1 Tax=unclassified Nostoc TaxID=2593658 RepID=UPI0016241A1C|nr:MULTISPECIES: hypothetical protein [unclassified Nostoc]MBC1224944.1 hypothetical protein [Nostoc sp. UCD120]MBC1274570.1 hypothetical protein [Nostoc sp. UCD121]MBC1297092.1 hypothetical protein [Nostoc sp. UCD122]